MGERAHVRYSAVSSREEELRDRELPDRYSSRSRDLRYEFQIPETVPWRSIALAFFLLSFGTIFLLISHFIFTEHMGGDSSQAYGFLVLGFLIFLPGCKIQEIFYKLQPCCDKGLYISMYSSILWKQPLPSMSWYRICTQRASDYHLDHCYQGMDFVYVLLPICNDLFEPSSMRRVVLRVSWKTICHHSRLDELLVFV